MSDYFDSHTEFITGSTDIDNAYSRPVRRSSLQTATDKQTALISDGLTSVDVQDSTLELYACGG